MVTRYIQTSSTYDYVTNAYGVFISGVYFKCLFQVSIFRCALAARAIGAPILSDTGHSNPHSRSYESPYCGLHMVLATARIAAVRVGLSRCP